MKKVVGGKWDFIGAEDPCTLSACYTNADCAAGYCKKIDCVWENGVKSSYNMCAPSGS